MTKPVTERICAALREAKALKVVHMPPLEQVRTLRAIADRHKIQGIIINDSAANEYVGWSARFTVTR